MLGAEFLKAHMARICYLDGYSEGLNGMMAVAFTIKNRQKAGWWNGNFAELLSHHYDYSGNIPNPSVEVPDPRNFAFQQLLQEIDGIYAGFKQDNVTVAQSSINDFIHFSDSQTKPVSLYYAKLHEPLRPWFLENVSRNPERHSRIAVVGALTFFS